MTGTAVYEIRRARTREELAAALALRHDVFCVEQGVPVRVALQSRRMRDLDATQTQDSPRGERMGVEARMQSAA